MRRDHARARGARPTEKLRLEDVPHRLGRVACRPHVHGLLEAAAFPPRRILARQMQRRLERTGGALADAIAGQKGPDPMCRTGGEELQMLRVEVATAGTGLREVAGDPVVGPAVGFGVKFRQSVDQSRDRLVRHDERFSLRPASFRPMVRASWSSASVRVFMICGSMTTVP